MGQDKENMEAGSGCGCGKSGCGCKSKCCGGCKLLLGVLLGLLLATAAFGIYSMGRCGRHLCHLCPMSASSTTQAK